MIRVLFFAVALQLCASTVLAGDFSSWADSHVNAAERDVVLQFGSALQGVLSTPLDDRPGLEKARGKVIDALSCFTATVEGNLELLDLVYAEVVDSPSSVLHMDFVESLFPEEDVVADAGKCVRLSANR